MKTCRETLEKNVNITPKRIEELVQSFSKYGVSKVMIEARIQRHVNAITATQFIDLMNIGTSLRDGIAKVEDFFDRNAKPIGENSTAAEKPAAKMQQNEKPEKTEPAKTVEETSESPVVPDIPENVWDGNGETEAMTNEGEIIDNPVAGPELFSDDMEGFFDHD